MKKRMRLVPALASILALGMLCGCAVFDKDNRRTLNLLDENIQIKSTAGQIALAPVMIPVGTLALTTDAVVVNPAAQIPKAGDDVYDLYWKPRDADFFIKSVVFLPIVVLTPPTFVGDILLRCMFPDLF